MRLAVDDFSSGSSVLSRLHHVPVDVLKVDRSFVQPLSRPRPDTRVVDGLVSMAHALGMDVVIEGVEDAQQAHAAEGPPVGSPAMATRRRVWTDGACKGNPGPGGWAWVADDRRWASGAEAQSTNQRMEIMAAHQAVLAHREPVTVVSDSTYVVNCFRDGWWRGWLAKDWKNSQRKPIANRDLWEPFIELVRERGDVEFEWVKGHGGDEMNDIADRLAVAAADTQTQRSGRSVPDEPDLVPTAPAAPPARDPRLPAGRLLGVFGARPPELGGYDANPVSDAVGRRLQEIIAAKSRMHPELYVVSGLRLGAEMLGAEAAVAEGVPVVAVLPFPDADKPWPDASRRRFDRLRTTAACEVLLERKRPETTAKVAGSLRRRDAWLAKNLDEAVVVWDGQEPFVGRLLDTLRDRLGDDVWEEPVPPAGR